MGGGFALAAAAGHGFDASSVNYGMLPRDLDDDLRGACPIVGSYGGRDMSLRGAPAKLEDALTRLGVPHDLKEYPDAGHSFLNDARGAGGVRLLTKRILGAGPNPEARPTPGSASRRSSASTCADALTAPSPAPERCPSRSTRAAAR